jgi:predicted RND superfamily exporter protein
MKKIPGHIAQFILKSRLFVLLFILLLILLSLSQIHKLQLRNDLSIWIDPGSNDYQNYQDFVDEFGNDESIIVLYHSDSLLSNRGLKLIFLFTEKLESIAGVEKVISLSSIKKPGNNVFSKQWLPLIPRKTNHSRKLEEKLLNYKSLRNNLISEDAKTSSFTLLLDKEADKKKVLKQVDTLRKTLLYKSGESIVYGVVPLKDELNRLSSQESRNFLLAAIALMFFLNLLIFRRIKEAILPLVVALLAIGISLGIMAACGISLNVVISILPLVLLVLSMAYSIHFISALRKELEAGHNNRQAILNTFDRIFINCFVSALTTSIALFLFSFSSISPLAHFGLFASLGVLISFLISFAFLSVIYSYWGMKTKPKTLKKQFEYRQLSKFVFQHKKRIIVVSFLIFILSIAGISKLKFNTNQLSYFKNDNLIKQSTDTAALWLKGIFPVELIFTLDTNVFDNQADYLNRFRQLDVELAQMEEIKSWQSPSLIWDDFAQSKSPALLKAKQEEGMLSHFVSTDGKSIRYSIKTAWLNDQQTMELIANIRQLCHKIFDKTEVHFHFTGSSVVFSRLSNRLVRSQMKSIVWSFILIFLVFLVVYKKIALSLLCLLPNFLPVATTLGIMGLLHIPLDVASVLLASVSLGIAIDDSVHFMSEFNKAHKRMSGEEAVLKAYQQVGNPIIITTTSLVLGFSIMVFSSYTPVVYLGIFISLNIILALVYDLFLLPALLEITE